MKKLVISVFAVFMMFAVIPTQLHAIAKTAATTTMAATEPVESEVANTLKSRLNEISQIDRSNMTRLEKKELRKEVRAIKSELKNLNGGVYLSVGAIILIVLVLILVL